MKFLFLSLLVLAGCASTAPLSKPPVDALIPELPFSYLQNGKWIEAKGQVATYYSAGEPKQLKVHVHEHAGSCQVVVIDGDSNVTQDCGQHGDIVINLGKHYNGEPNTLGISVATKNLGTQFGYWYLSGGPVRAALPMDFKCPQQSTTGPLSTCTRPATFAFNFSANIVDNFPGKVQYAYQCAGDQLVTSQQDIAGATKLDYSLNSSAGRYCALRVDVIQNQQSDGTWAIKKSATINVRFYDPSYIPLPIPAINGTQVCGAEDYKAVTVDGQDYYWGLGSGSCHDFGDFHEVIVWDALGRVAWNVRGAARLGVLSKYRNGYQFYVDARPYIEREVKKCGLTEACARKVIYSPKVTQAVLKWDASKLK